MARLAHEEAHDEEKSKLEAELRTLRGELETLQHQVELGGEERLVLRQDIADRKERLRTILVENFLVSIENGKIFVAIRWWKVNMAGGRTGSEREKRLDSLKKAAVKAWE